MSVNNTGKLMKLCNEYMEFLESDQYSEDSLGDYENEIFEEALKMCLGPDIFDRVTSLMELQDKK